MSKSIKIEDDVYRDLDIMKGKGDTFSQVVARLITSARLTMQAHEALGEFPQVTRSKTYDLAAHGAGHRVQENEQPWRSGP